MNTDTQPLYDLAPLVQLMLLGLVIALGPLAWVWARHRRRSPLRRLQALTLLTLFLTFDLVLFGAFTRLTDSGLGCPDWPGCYGNASPVGAHAEIATAQAALPTGPVTHGKAWVEMLHRYLALGVGVLISVLTLSAWVQHGRARRGAAQPPPISPWWPTATLLWVCLQGAFGALTVTMKLFPAIVTLHLAGGLVLLALLCVQAVRHAQAHGPLRPQDPPAQGAQGRLPVELAPALRRGLAATGLLLAMQLLAGGWVSTNYAVLACTTFPTCQGSWWPAMDFAQGFAIWRPLGLRQDGSHIDFAGLTAIHYTHRLLAYATLPALGLLAWRLHHHRRLPAQARWLAILGLLQLATGLSSVVLGWPLLAAVMHTGGAAALVLVWTWAWVASRAEPPTPALCPPANAPRMSA